MIIDRIYIRTHHDTGDIALMDLSDDCHEPDDNYLLEPDGTLLRYDDVAGYYSRHHRLTAEQETRLRSAAATFRAEVSQ